MEILNWAPVNVGAILRHDTHASPFFLQMFSDGTNQQRAT